MLASKIPSSASAFMNPALAAQFDYNSNLTEFHYILEDYVYLQDKLDRLEFASLQLEKQERLTEQVKEKLDNTYDRLSQITNKKKKEAAKLEQLKHLSIRSFFSKIKGTRSSELIKAEKVYQNTCKQYEQAKKAFDVNKSLWDESKKELLECQTNNKNYNRYKNELEELLQEVFDGPTPNFPQEDALEQQVMKLFLNFTQLSQVIHQCELAKDNLRNAHMYLVNFFKGSQSVRDYASVWDLSSTSVIKIIKENEKHDELTILSDAKDYVKQANEKIQHARVLLTNKTNLTSNKIERLEELFESIVDSQEFKNRDTGIKRIDSNLEKELGETRIWLGEEIQSLTHAYTKQEKELAIFKTKLFEERQNILNLWVINLDDSIKKRMIENSTARGRKRTKSKILKSLSQEDENDSNWFDNSGITCAADLAIRNNTISRNASVKSSATLFNKEIDSMKVGSCPVSNGFYTLNNINQYIGSTPSLDYYHDPTFNSLPRWPMNHQNNSLYTIPDNLNSSGMDYSTPSFKAQSEIIKNDMKFSDSHSQGGNSVSHSNRKSSDSQSSSSNSNKRNIKHSTASKKSFPTRSGTRNSHSSNHFGHATTSAININGTRNPSLDYALNNSFASLSSTPNSYGMISGYNQNVIPRIHPNGSNYMYHRYSLDQYSLQAAYHPQYYSYSASANDISANPTSMFNPYTVSSNSFISNPINTSIAATNMSVPTMSPLSAMSTTPSKNVVNHNTNTKISSSASPTNETTIQRSRSAIVSHVMDKPLNRGVVNETINLHLPSSPSKSTHTSNGGGTIPNLSQLQQSPMFPFPQRSRSVSVANYKPKEERKVTSPFSFHRKKHSNTLSNILNSIDNDSLKNKVNKEEKKSLSKIPTISLEDITGSTSIILSKEDDESIEVINEIEEEEEEEEENDNDNDNDDSSSSTSSSESDSSSSSSSSNSDDNDSESLETSDDDGDDDNDDEDEDEVEKEEEKIQETREEIENEIENEIEKPIITNRKDSKNINVESFKDDK
ncbi:hypothetical protein U3516DRAFT_582079 [Neocallimastix sp. 'constans']|jgi:hypothetical protein